ncbi:hypothetical protein FRX31_008063, partial [Thalictrum thalictroides]
LLLKVLREVENTHYLYLSPLSLSPISTLFSSSSLLLVIQPSPICAPSVPSLFNQIAIAKMLETKSTINA